MAGEIEEPFSISFQADSFRSGSISFGRFENESLSWERRSSFSHNRYLEEVEKCSKPGSVIEKKAYFEAHFKKKALLLQGSSEGQTESEHQPGEGDVLENEGYRDEVHNVNELSHYDQFDVSVSENAGHREYFAYVNEASQINQGNEGSQFDYANKGNRYAHEKKAYFEAHFKKKALLLQGSSEGQTESEHQPGEGDVLENEGYRDEVHNVNELSHYDRFDVSVSENAGHREYFAYVNEASQINQGNEGSQFDYANKGNRYAHEKKAYFEAHFKKKALLLQGSSEGQTESEHQPGEGDVLENEGYRDEVHNVNELSHYDRFDVSVSENAGHREYFAYVNEASQINQGNEGSQFDYANKGNRYAHEKKAYFEAHFKKKALLLQGSSEGQTESEHQPVEGDVLENEGYRDEFHNVNELSHYDQFDVSVSENAGYREYFSYVNEASQINQGNEGNQFDYANKGHCYAHEKKAYFEAHFKKKALLLQGSSEGQTESEHQPGEGDVLENEGYRDEVHNVNELSHYDQFDVSVSENAGHREYFAYVNEASQINQGNEGSQFDYANKGNRYTHDDESPEGSEYEGEYEGTECERGDLGVLSAESQVEAALSNTYLLVDSVPEDINLKKTHQSETGCNKSLLDNDEQVIEVNENLNDSAVNVDESSKPVDPSTESVTVDKVDKTSSKHRQNLSPKLRAATESKYTGPRLRSQINGHIQKNIPRDAPKIAAKNDNGRKKESTGRTKLDKHSLQTAAPARHSLHRSPKKEDSESSNSKSDLETKSEKEVRAKKEVESQPSTSKKIELRMHPTSNRLKQTLNATKPDKRPNSIGFNFKSSERAERRKEFYMKLEEKMHAKEAEISQIQARTQEKTEAEVKQFRKSLNFKATPMPSFYQVAARPGPHNKAVSCNTRPAKGRNKSTNPVTGAAARLPLVSKAGNDQNLSVSELANKSHLCESSEATDCPTTEAGTVSSVLSSDGNSCPEAVMKNDVNGKKQREEKDTKLRRHRVSERRKVTKDQKVEGKLKVGARRTSNEMVNKSMKGVGLGGSSSVGHLAVGVAS